MEPVNPGRGDIWRIKSNRTTGQEIRKERHMIVMNVPKAGRQKMRIVAPITTGCESHENLFWMVRIRADTSSGLDHDSFVDASQIQAVSVNRFIEQTGVLESQVYLDKIAAAIALCVGYSPKNRKRKRK